MDPNDYRASDGLENAREGSKRIKEGKKHDEEMLKKQQENANANGNLNSNSATKNSNSKAKPSPRRTPRETVIRYREVFEYALMATYTPPPYFPQSSLSPPDEKRYRKFKLMIASLILLVLCDCGRRSDRYRFSGQMARAIGKDAHPT